MDAVGNSNWKGDLPYYLLFPFFASILLAFGALFTKRAISDGYSPWVIANVGNVVTSVLFSSIWLFGGTIPSLWLLWQPAVIGMLYLIGQTLILMAVSHGDVSIALPVASCKVLFVTILLAATSVVAPGNTIWVAAFLSVFGVVLINYVAPQSERRNILLTLFLATGGAATFAVFDVCLQAWSIQDSAASATHDGRSLESDGLLGNWPTGRLLPISFWFMAICSMLILPLFDAESRKSEKRKQASLWFAALFVGVQAWLMCFSLSMFGDAARINVVYSLRGLWGVVLAWGFASSFQTRESGLPTRIMLARLGGAILLISAVILIIATR